MISSERVVQGDARAERQLMWEDQTNRRATMQPPIWSQSDPQWSLAYLVSLETFFSSCYFLFH